uniref:Uncharacterized protein n=1 Tax=Oryza punctata TaxID=4537 RepID=A0A0E0LLQ3_ORYPU
MTTPASLSYATSLPTCPGRTSSTTLAVTSASSCTRRPVATRRRSRRCSCTVVWVR